MVGSQGRREGGCLHVEGPEGVVGVVDLVVGMETPAEEAEVMRGAEVMGLGVLEVVGLVGLVVEAHVTRSEDVLDPEQSVRSQVHARREVDLSRGNAAPTAPTAPTQLTSAPVHLTTLLPIRNGATPTVTRV